jgi:hypothetical protein
MWQPCFGKAIIMHKYVGVYILLLMYNSSSMCYIGNIVKNLKLYIYISFFAMKWMKIIYACINLI